MRQIPHAVNPSAIPVQELLALRVRSLWRMFAAQDLAYWAMCSYLVVEYVRPQQLITAIYGFPLGQITLGLALAAHVLSGRFFTVRGTGSWLFLAFTAVIVLASVSAFNPAVSFREIQDVWLSWVIIYFLIINVVNTQQRFVFFLLLWLGCHYYMSQGGAKQFALRGFRFASWGITGAPGWFANSGEFGIAMCMFASVSWQFYLAARPYLSKWRKLLVIGMPVTAVLGIIGSSSRGALLGLAGIGLWTLLRTRRPFRTILGISVLSAATWMVLPPEQKARFQTAGEDDTSVNRLLYWEAGLDMARERPVFGIGYNNWVVYYARYYAPILTGGRTQVSHNIFIQCVAELGLAGLLVFVALIVVTLTTSYQTRKLASAGPDPPNTFAIQISYGLDGAMISYVVAGFFVTVLYYPFFWVNLALTVALNTIVRSRATVRAASAPAPRVAVRPSQRRIVPSN